MVTALGLYCELLAEPGVLGADHRHYAQELRLVTSASRALVEKLSSLRVAPLGGCGNSITVVPHSRAEQVTALPGTRVVRHTECLPGDEIDDLAAEVRANRKLLDAMAGLGVRVTVATQAGAQPVRLTAEDLTRILVNLVKNAAEAMPGGGEIGIALRGLPHVVLLIVEDSGAGIPARDLEAVFQSGFTTKINSPGAWPRVHRGLGLSITRSIVDAAGGCMRAGNRPEGGARFEIELPIRRR